MEFETYVPLAGSLIIAIVLSSTFVLNWKASKINHKDIALRQRPWISFFRHANHTSAFDFSNDKKVKIYIINRGPIPAFNVKQFSYLSTEKQNFVEWERDPIALGPSEIWNFSVYNPNHLKKFHLGFKLTYDDLEGKNHFFIYEATYDNGIRHGKGHSLD
ncbi:MAG: hypothetical protein GKS07_10340 [Nitrosopumilus sp.]|nr:MAG: hypothetical protein GKS07_10340 [Nitrosopumilus sp.]